MPYFFLSYARADDDGYLERFYSDLREAVRGRTGLGADQVGYHDKAALALGSAWKRELETALATARVFVAMCSPSYFASEMCGHEWQMFLELARQRQSGDEAVPANLLPVIWIPTANTPDVVRRLQHSHEGLGRTYRTEGLQFLARLRRYRDEYQHFVTRLAERIVTVGAAQATRRPAHVPQLEEVPNAFSAGTPPVSDRREEPRQQGVGPSQPRGSVLPPGGPRHVNFVIVAPPSHEVGGIRQDTQFYGPTAYDWAPYKPQFRQRICVFAQNIASTHDMTSSLATAESSIVGLLAQAVERNELVVLIVDVWCTKLSRYQAVLTEYDERNAPTSAVLVPWNEADPETRQRRPELWEDLRRALPNNTARGDDVFRPSIPTHERLEADLEEALAVMQSRIFQFGAVRRRAGGDRTVERPVLTQPDEGVVR